MVTRLRATATCPGHGGICYREGDEFTVYWREGVATINCRNPSGEAHFLCTDTGKVRTEADLHKIRDMEVLPFQEAKA